MDVGLMSLYYQAFRLDLPPGAAMYSSSRVGPETWLSGRRE